MPPQAPAPTSAKATGGPVHAVRCPWCGKTSDFRGLDSASLIDKGSEFNCDHCNHVNIVTSVKTVKMITLIQHPKKTGHFSLYAKKR